MYQLQVDGMNCSHCISKVTKSVKMVDGAAMVDINLASGMVRLESQADLDELSAAITEAGYPVKASKVV